MATPTTLPSSFTVGAVLTATQMNNLRGAFRILQVVGATTTTGTSSATTTYVDCGVSASITPSATSSKVLVIVTQNMYNSAATGEANIKLLRGSTDLFTHVAGWLGTSSANSGMWSHAYLDSPNTTSATTYKTQFNRAAGAGTIFCQVNTNLSSIILCEVSA